MNRLMCRVIMGVAGLAVLGMTVTLAGAQTDAVKEKPLLYRYESYWMFPPAHLGDVDKDDATSIQKALAPALADGTLIGYGDDENLVRSKEAYTHSNVSPRASNIPTGWTPSPPPAHPRGQTGGS